jgi:ribose transport system substrate-binding protein
MKKLVVLVMFACIVFSGCQAKKADEKKAFKIGYTVMDLTNPVFAAILEQVQKIAAEKGWQLTATDCKSEASAQLTQIENFITSGCDVIIIHAADPNSLTEVSERAHARGIVLVAYSIEFPEADINYTQDNIYAGELVGEAGGKWLTERYGPGAEVEVAVFNYPFVLAGIEREEGIMAGLAKTAPGAKVVATGAGFNISEGMTIAENIMQAHPNVKAFLSILDAAALGACEVLEALDVNPVDYGIFAIDATKEAQVKIEENTPFRMSVSFGTPKEMADIIGEIFADVEAGNYKDTYYTPTSTVDITNLAEYRMKD